MSGQIPFVTQLNNNYRNDCAFASAAMLIGAYTDSTPTIGELVTRYGVPNQFTTIAQLMRCLNAEGVPVAYTSAATWEFYQQKWHDNVPVIGLLAMHVIADNDGFPYAHFAPCVGRENHKVKLLNPLRLQAPHLVPEIEFIRAITERSRYVGGTNNPLQAVYPVAPLSAPVPTMFDRISTVAAEIHIAADVLRKAG
jgi:hypothetical protein